MNACVCLIHGAGGGAWEFDYFWKKCFLEADFENWNAIELLPESIDYSTTTFQNYLNQVIDFVQLKSDNFKKDVYLVGASMGAVLVLKACSFIEPKGIILVCPTIPLEVKRLISSREVSNLTQELVRYPDLIEWSKGNLQDTVDAMPDADMETCIYAANHWRDESGIVLNEIISGVSCDPPPSLCYCLVVIPESDKDIPVQHQEQLATYLNAEILRYPSMSHVGPLLSTKANVVANDVIKWIKSKF